MTEQEDKNPSPEEKLRREAHLALIALGLKMPTTEQEVAIAMRGHQLDKTPLPEYYRDKQLSPTRRPTKSQSQAKQGPERRPEQRPER